MKKVSIVLVAIMFCALVPYGISQAAQVTANVVSKAESDVYGPSPDPFGEDPGAAVLGFSVLLSPVDASWPQASLVPDANDPLTGAVWITTATQNATQTTYRLFEDSFVPACTATHLVGNLHTAANNVQTVYINDALPVLGDDSGDNPPLPVLQTFPFTVLQDPANIPKVNTFGFEVLTRPAGEPNPDGAFPNPAGLIYRAEITYDLPTVFWRPPIVNTKRAIVKNGTTLPIKFRLRNELGLIRTVQNIYLSITGPGSPGVEVKRFSPGHGLKFAPGNGQYMANFHTKLYNLQTEAQYTISVNDGCSGEMLGSLIMKVYGKGPHKHGKK